MICSTVQDKLWQPHRHVLPQTPISVVALEALGRLAERFPPLSGTVVSSLCRFLLDPCPLLTKLSAEMDRGGTEPQLDVVARRKMGINSLRTAAIDALCRALKAVVPDEADAERRANGADEMLLQTCLTQLSTKLYLQENAALER